MRLQLCSLYKFTSSSTLQVQDGLSSLGRNTLPDCRQCLDAQIHVNDGIEGVNNLSKSYTSTILHQELPDILVHDFRLHIFPIK